MRPVHPQRKFPAAAQTSWAAQLHIIPTSLQYSAFGIDRLRAGPSRIPEKVMCPAQVVPGSIMGQRSKHRTQDDQCLRGDSSRKTCISKSVQKPRLSCPSRWFLRMETRRKSQAAVLYPFYRQPSLCRAMGMLGEKRDATPGLMKPIHHRMPVILNPNDYFLWLDPTRPDLPKRTSFLKAYPAEDIEVYPASPLVNNPRNDTSLCIQPL